jgi:hypothetical protein
MIGLKMCEPCRQKFKELRILTVISLYVFEVLCYMKKYRGILMENSVIHEHKYSKEK